MATIFDGEYCVFGKRTTPQLSFTRDATELTSEFLGTLLFAYFGSLAVDGPWGNGLALAVIVYCTAAVSGGKLNPVVSIAVALIDSNPALVSVVKVLFECAAQVGGAVLGVMAATYFGAGSTGLGCFAAATQPKDLTGVTTNGVIMGHEAFATGLLVLTVLSTAVEEAGKTRFAMMAPLAIGLSLFVAANAVAPWTGGCLNPARFLGAAIGGDCKQPWKNTWAYLVGELLGALVAVVIHMMRDYVRQRITCGSAPRKPKSATPMATKAPIIDQVAWGNRMNI
jgi:glycerol uptake facilitator-like aquaporin